MSHLNDIDDKIEDMGNRVTEKINAYGSAIKTD